MCSSEKRETAKKNAEADLEQTKIKIEEDLDDLEKNQALLDAALKELEELKPACVDTGMTYEERVAARDEVVVGRREDEEKDGELRDDDERQAADLPRARLVARVAFSDAPAQHAEADGLPDKLHEHQHRRHGIDDGFEA